MLNPNIFQSTPVYNIQRKSFAFQEFVRSTLSPTDFNLEKSSTHSSKISGSQSSSESSMDYLHSVQSPAPFPQLQTHEFQSPYKYPEPDLNYSKAYRKFMKRVVPVIRRRPIEEKPKDPLPEPKQETPKIPKKALPEKPSSTEGKGNFKKLNFPDIPLYQYENFRFQQICEEISKRRQQDKKYQIDKIRKYRSEFKLLGREMIFRQGHYIDNRNKDNKVVPVKQDQKFLPARKRYLKLGF